MLSVCRHVPRAGWPSSGAATGGAAMEIAYAGDRIHIALRILVPVLVALASLPLRPRRTPSACRRRVKTDPPLPVEF